MLQAIRERAQGWIAWVIVILISIPFALWGIQEYLGVGGETIVADVNGQEITERDLNNRYQRFRTELRQRLGSAYRPELFDETRLRQEVLEDMIRSHLILQATSQLGLNAGDDQVRAAILDVEAFQRNGRFDRDAYERALSFQGLSSVQFEEQVRGSLMSAQLSQMVGASELVTNQELMDAVRLKRQTRSFSYFMLPRERFEAEDAPPEADLEAYYQAHQEEYRTPEQVKVNYIVLDHSAAGSASEADEATLKSLYESRLEEYRTPEQRQARHILVTVQADASAEQEAAAKAKIQSLRERIVAGEDFAQVAKESSEDPGSAASGGDLGMFERGIMDPAFENTTFSLQQGVLSEPVRSAFGYHLIEVTAIEPESIIPFEEVRDELVALHGSEEAEQRYFDLAEQLGNLTYENPDSLVPAAEALGLTVLSSDWLGREGAEEGPLANPKVMGAAFSEDVLKQGNNSELLEVEVDGRALAVALRVTEHQESFVKPLDDVRELIVAAITQDKAQQAALAQAQALADRLRAGEAIAQIAEGYEVIDAQGVDRNAPAVPLDILDQAFALTPGSDQSTAVGVTDTANGDAVVVLLTEVTDGNLEALGEDQKRRESESLARGLSRAYYDDLVDHVRDRANVTIISSARQ